MTLKRKVIAATKRAVPNSALNVVQSASVQLRRNPHYNYMRWQRQNGKYAFIHINKCGGTSIEKALDIPVKVHDTALQRRNKIGRRAWDRMFTFAVVRHPFDRVASLYRYRVRTAQTGMGDGSIDLNSWVEEVWHKQNPALVDQPIMFAPCVDWISDSNGRIMVDEVIKLEKIKDAWPKISDVIDGPAELPMANTTKKSGSTADALTQASKEIILDNFSADFKLLGYKP